VRILARLSALGLAAAAAAAFLPTGGAAATSPAFRPAPCPAKYAPLKAQCGYLTVPENRASKSTRTIRLAVAVVASTSRTPRPDPLFFVQGGPSAGAIQPQLTSEFFLRDRDFVALDLRGTGYSKPYLGCRELDAVQAASYPRAPRRAQYLAAVGACRARLTAQGVDLAAYNDEESAADIEALRLALGFPKWNVFAISAGGELALTYLRKYPRGIRSLVLDSAWGNRTVWGPTFWVNAHRVVNLLLDRCQADPACRAAHPNLRARLERFVRSLGAKPVDVLIPKPSPAIAGELRRSAEAASARPDLRIGTPTYLPGGTTAVLPLTYTTGDDAAIEIADALLSELEQKSRAVETTVIGGPALWSAYKPVAKEELAKGETIGFPIILLILLFGFGTVVAAGAPVVIGFVAVFVTAALTYFLSRIYTMSIFVTNMAAMIGLGVAVDYSLFIVSRFRIELQQGLAKEEALRKALVTSGKAVVFSGATVIASLAGLLLIDMSAIRSMAIGAMIVVAVAVIASVTLLPALLFLLGARIERLRLPWAGRGEAGGAFWETWTRTMLRHPFVSLGVGAAIMLTLAIPILSMSPFQRALTLLPADSQVRQATERAKELAGPGITGPVQVLASDRAAAEELRGQLARMPEVAGIGPTLVSADGKYYLTEAVLTSDPESAAARSAYRRIEAAARPIEARRGAEVVLGGTTAGLNAIKTTIIGGLWKLILFISVMSYLVLLFLLRSLLLPLKAVFMNLLSVGAAYGVLIAVFQWGWLDWTGFNSPGYIDSLVPALVLAVTFGLSMDYEVFLLGRIRERYQIHGSNDDAVSEGVQQSARIITSAALIMVGVFGAFAIAGSVQLRELGVGLAVAVGLDATIVRLVIVPATMRLLGDWNWWLPRRLDRLLPAIEG